MQVDGTGWVSSLRQAPKLLRMGIPTPSTDFASGEVDRFVEDLLTIAAFRNIGPELTRQCMARGMGFDTWQLYVLQEAPCIAEVVDLPDRDTLLLHLIAWRMYLSGPVGIREAVTGLFAAWSSSRLKLRSIYGDTGDLSLQGATKRSSPGNRPPDRWLGGLAGGDASRRREDQVASSCRARARRGTVLLGAGMREVSSGRRSRGGQERDHATG